VVDFRGEILFFSLFALLQRMCSPSLDLHLSHFKKRSCHNVVLNFFAVLCSWPWPLFWVVKTVNIKFNELPQNISPQFPIPDIL
jgi:hypothetical protein